MNILNKSYLFLRIRANLIYIPLTSATTSNHHEGSNSQPSPLWLHLAAAAAASAASQKVFQRPVGPAGSASRQPHQPQSPPALPIQLQAALLPVVGDYHDDISTRHHL